MTPQDVLKLCEEKKVEFIDLLRRINQTIQRPLTDAGNGASKAPPGKN